MPSCETSLCSAVQYSPMVVTSSQRTGNKCGSCHENNKDDEKDDKDTENFYHQPPIGCHRLEIFKDFTVSSLYVQLGIFHIGINSAKWNKRYLPWWKSLPWAELMNNEWDPPLHHFFLLLDHMSQLLEDPSQLDYGLLDVLHGVCSALYIWVLLINELQLLLVALSVNGVHIDGDVAPSRHAVDLILQEDWPSWGETWTRLEYRTQMRGNGC